MIDNFNQYVIKGRFVFIVFMLSLVFGASIGLEKAKFSSDYRIFFSADNPQLKAFESLQATFTKNDNVMFVIAPKDGKVFTPKILDIVERLTHEAWQLPYSTRVDSITNYQHTAAEEDDLIVDDLVRDALSKTPEELEQAKAIALAEPVLKNRLISEKADVTAVNVATELPGVEPTKEIPEVAHAARELRDKFLAETDLVDIHLTGRIMGNQAFKDASLHDLSHIVPMALLIALACIAIYMYIASGSILTMFSGTFAIVIVIVSSVLFAMGLSSWMDIAISTPTTNAPTMILTLAVADCIHILITFFQQMRFGKEKKQAMLESLRLNHQPVFLTSITTVIGFLSLNFSDAPPFRDLGNIVALGVAAAWVFAITLLPSIVLVLPIKINKAKEQDLGWPVRFADWLIRNFKGNLIISSVIILACGAFLPANELNDVWSDYFDKDMQQRQDSDFTRERLTGLNNISYTVNSGEPSGISDPHYLQQLQKAADWFETQPEVRHVNTFTDIMKRLNRNMHGDDTTWYKLPDDRELAAQYLLLYEMSLPFGLDLTNQVNFDKSATRLTVTVNNLSTSELLDLQARANHWLKKNIPDLDFGQGSSSDIMFAYIGSRNVKSMLEGTFVALILISLVLAISLRSFSYGMISLLPNILPAVVAFGLWGIFEGRVGLSLSVVAGMTLGIVVDFSVHFLSKYLRAKRENHFSTEDAIRYAFSTVGVALFVTTIILFANFAVLSFSGFALNSQMGLMTAVTIVVALLVDFFFLPPLILYLAGRKHRDSNRSKSEFNNNPAQINEGEYSA